MTLGQMSDIWKTCGKRKGDGRLQINITPPNPQLTNVTQSPIIYLPIEFQSREFDSKVLLAATLTERGYAVVLGQQWLLYENISRLPPGVILFKSFNKIHQAAMAHARQSGHRVVILDEEMLAQTEVKAVKALCIEGIFQWPDLILADGQFDHEILKRLSNGRNRIEITGNGRIDLLKPALRPLFQREIDEIVAHHGDFVLVNTNFSDLQQHLAKRRPGNANSKTSRIHQTRRSLVNADVAGLS